MATTSLSMSMVLSCNQSTRSSHRPEIEGQVAQCCAGRGGGRVVGGVQHRPDPLRGCEGIMTLEAACHQVVHLLLEGHAWKQNDHFCLHMGGAGQGAISSTWASAAPPLKSRRRYDP